MTLIEFIQHRSFWIIAHSCRAHFMYGIAGNRRIIYIRYPSGSPVLSISLAALTISSLIAFSFSPYSISTLKIGSPHLSFLFSSRLHDFYDRANILHKHTSLRPVARFRKRIFPCSTCTGATYPLVHSARDAYTSYAKPLVYFLSCL